MKIAYTHRLTWQSIIGVLNAYENNGKITSVTFGETKSTKDDGIQDSPLLHEAKRQITAYLDGGLKTFDLPCDFSSGTAFQQQVWQAVSEIPYGQTASYADIARRIGNPRAVRAVGMANHSNPLPLIIPCHRVIGKDGSLTGYAGGLPAKRYLLDLELK